MILTPIAKLQTQQIVHSHKNDYLNDRLNAQRVLAVISLIIPFALFSLYLLAPHANDSGSAVHLMVTSVFVIALAVVRLIANWEKPREDIYQLTCAFLDFLGIAAILIGYAYVYDVPISVALKSPTANMFFVFLTSRVVLIHGPILLKTCGAAVITWTALTCLALFEPEFAGRTNSYIEYLTSFKILIGAEVERILQFIIITAILYTFIYLIRHDPATGYLRRPIFLQSVAKFLNDSRRKTPKGTHALIEVKITSLASTDLYDDVFCLISDLPFLKFIKLIKIGRLSNRNVAIWISYPHDQIDLDDFINKLSAELTQAAVSNLGSKVPPILIGGTLFDYESSSEEQLIYTDIAIRDAITNGKKARIFDQELCASIIHKDVVKQAIEYGLSHNLFSVHYQPIIDLMTDKPIGFEALVRLTDKNGKNIPPNIFIPIAESTGLVSDITDKLCTIISNEASLIHKIYSAESTQPYINVNIAPQQLTDIDATLAALRRAQSSGVKINVEITESSVLNENNTLEQINKLRQAGFSVAIDDFGTGHSSINRLNTLNVSTLKIDQCFTKNVENIKGFNFLKAIVDLSLTTSESVIIEGVETLSQKLLLMKMGVRYCQGYFFAKPMSLVQLDTYLENIFGRRSTIRNRLNHTA